ncbi:hypothetical protein GCM10011609_87720 [Lentzea pudingi]|uniref:Uncharacterized protein n=1 Tax=Lentzea pudingi TaxID=1789439 RepID=A0ABQ2IUL3_9PSEU|nr:hypothetical protein GCM10011609_87720 [Lentzea pudingi]
MRAGALPDAADRCGAVGIEQIQGQGLELDQIALLTGGEDGVGCGCLVQPCCAEAMAVVDAGTGHQDAALGGV